MSKYLLFLFSALVLIGCDKDDDSDSVTEDMPWERQFLSGNLVINSVDVLTSEVNTTNTSILDKVCYSDLPDGEFRTFSFNLFIPSHMDPDFQAGFREREWIIFFGGTMTSDIYTSGSITFIERIEINGVEYSRFSMSGSYDGSSPITKDNFQQMRIDFDIAYLDASGEEYYSAPRAVTINIDGC